MGLNTHATTEASTTIIKPMMRLALFSNQHSLLQSTAITIASAKRKLHCIALHWTYPFAMMPYLFCISSNKLRLFQGQPKHTIQ